MAATKVVMPKLSEAMETGKLIKWLKKEGDRVQGGDIIAEIETDKADVEMEAFGAGVLRKVLLQPGDRAPVGALIAVIAEPDDDISSLLAGVAAAAPAGPPAPAPAVAQAPGTPSAPAPAPIAPTPAPVSAAPPGSRRPTAVPSPAPRTPAETGGSERVRVSPLARRIAAQAGMDLRLIQGSGPAGRIVRRDVEAAMRTAHPSEAAPGAVPLRPALRPAAEGPEYEDLALPSIRASIAKQMVLSKAPIPHFYVTSEVAMDRASELREQLNQLEGEPKITLNDLVVRACAIALVEHPGVNASFQGESVRVHHRAHIGIAVALDDGLITPVLRNCESKSLAQIAAEGRDLVERTRARKLRANELSGATFTVSNLGMFDVVDFSAIINPPEGAILAVGAVRHVPVVTPAGLGIGRRMHLTLSCDHRAMDGAMGARFLQSVKRLLEEPLRLLL
jgi:pyruvate dehydrogenase E2 component (dihydrolipoamide acetyltransferase)